MVSLSLDSTLWKEPFFFFKIFRYFYKFVQKPAGKS